MGNSREVALNLCVCFCELCIDYTWSRAQVLQRKPATGHHPTNTKLWRDRCLARTATLRVQVQKQYVDSTMFLRINGFFYHYTQDISFLFNFFCGFLAEDCPKCSRAVWNPVCGSDYRTYSNGECLRSLACRRRRNIAVEHYGPCTHKSAILGRSPRSITRTNARDKLKGPGKWLFLLWRKSTLQERSLLSWVGPGLTMTTVPSTKLNLQKFKAIFKNSFSILFLKFSISIVPDMVIRCPSQFAHCRLLATSGGSPSFSWHKSMEGVQI